MSWFGWCSPVVTFPNEGNERPLQMIKFKLKVLQSSEHILHKNRIYLISLSCWFFKENLFYHLSTLSLLVKVKNGLFCVWTFLLEQLFLVCGCELSLWLLSLHAVLGGPHKHTLFHSQHTTKPQLSCLFTKTIENISSWSSQQWGKFILHN